VGWRWKTKGMKRGRNCRCRCRRHREVAYVGWKNGKRLREKLRGKVLVKLEVEGESRERNEKLRGESEVD
jgi:hypothetical protein